MKAGDVARIFKAGVLFEVSMLKSNKGYFAATLARPYFVYALLLLISKQLGAGYTPRDVVVQTLAVTGSIDVLWDVAGQGILLRVSGVLPYYTLSPGGVLLALVVSYLPRYILETLLKAVAFLPVLALEEGPADALLHLLAAYALLLLGLLPLLGISTLVAGATLLVHEESPVLEWVTPLVLLLSGAVYPVSVLPGWMRALSALIPVTYVVELSRALEGGGGVQAFYSGAFALLISLSILYNAVASRLFRKAEEALLRKGV